MYHRVYVRGQERLQAAGLGVSGIRVASALPQAPNSQTAPSIHKTPSHVETMRIVPSPCPSSRKSEFCQARMRRKQRRQIVQPGA